LLTPEKITITNIPDILDVNLLIELLGEMGVKIDRQSRDTCIFQADDVNIDYLRSEAYRSKSGKLRGSVMLAGPMLARFRKAFISKPGGDKIGRRRLDTHIIGFEKLGVQFTYHPEDLVFFPWFARISPSTSVNVKVTPLTVNCADCPSWRS